MSRSRHARPPAREDVQPRIADAACPQFEVFRSTVEPRRYVLVEHGQAGRPMKLSRLPAVPVPNRWRCHARREYYTTKPGAVTAHSHVRRLQRARPSYRGSENRAAHGRASRGVVRLAATAARTCGYCLLFEGRAHASAARRLVRNSVGRAGQRRAARGSLRTTGRLQGGAPVALQENTPLGIGDSVG